MHQSSKQSGCRSTGLVSFSRHISLSFSLALLIILFGNTETVLAAAPKPTEAEMVAVMEWHYKAAILSHDALIQGDFEKMRSRLARIIEKSLPASAPKSWRPHHARLHKAALSGVSGITSLDSAGSVMGDVAEACGACHAALKVGNIYFWPAPPDKDDKFKTTMRTHQWASERLWEGVTGPFEEAWPRGAEALAATRIFKNAGGTVKASLRAREAELREMGRKAKAATGLHQRAVIYGRLLTTCARCHQEAGVTIEPAKTTTPWQE